MHMLMCVYLCFTMSFYECVGGWIPIILFEGMWLLQPHNLIDELDNIPGDDEAIVDLKNGPFGEIVKSAKVTCPTITAV